MNHLAIQALVIARKSKTLLVEQTIDSIISLDYTDIFIDHDIIPPSLVLQQKYFTSS
jgi:hypothetical protein